MKGTATRVPGRRSKSVTLPTSAPASTTSPLISWPSTAGVGNFTSPCITCRSEWHTPHLRRGESGG